MTNPATLTALPVISRNMREVWLNDFVTRARPAFEAQGYPIPVNLRVSIGLPPQGYRSKAIGVCIAPTASLDGHWEIFISPMVTAGYARVADILTHELIHAAVSMDHGREFTKVCRALGLEGKPTSTTAGPQWFHWAAPILTELGPMDFAALNLTPPKVTKTWGRKVHCPDCGWIARASAKHIDAFPHLNCPVPDCGSIMITE